MSKVTSSWARPIQGVSQQPPKVMKDGQCREQINMTPSAVRGLEKRTGTEHIKKILTSLHPDAKIHHYRRGDAEEYFIIIEPDGIPKVFGVDGTRHTVVMNQGATYSAAANPKDTLALQTIADYTFIANKSKTVAATADVSPSAVHEAIVYLQYATYGRTYSVSINGAVVAEYLTPDGSVASHIANVDINYIIGQLAYGAVRIPTHAEFTPVDVYDGGETPTLIGCTITIPANATVLFMYETVAGTIHTIGVDGCSYAEGIISFPVTTSGKVINVVYEVPGSGGLSTLSGYEVVQYGASFHIKRTDGAAFEISTQDGAQNKDFIAITDSVTGAENLPPVAPDGFLIQVKGKGQKQEDSFYVKAVSTTAETKWVETLSPGMTYKFNPATMPQTLVRTSINEAGIATFTMDYGTWTDRDVGADDSNPWPTFKDQKIQSIGLFQNRLFFTSAESVCMSRSGQFFNFFRESTQLIAADDPIDVYADSAQINDLLHSVALDGDLVFFSPNAQFLLKGDKPVTKETATLKHTNSFSIQTAVPPVPTGESIYFAFDSGLYTGIRELFTDNIVDTKRARPVTEHVDRFIAGQIRSMTSSTNQNWMMIMADAPNIIYVYNWLWVGQDKAQSAWHRWIWPADERVEDVILSQDKMYFFISRAEGVFLEVINMGDANSNGLPYPARLDRQHTVTATKSGSRHTFPDTFPDEPLENLEYIMSTGAYPEYIGATVVFHRAGGVLYTDDEIGSGSTCLLVGGIKYKSTFVPSQPTVKDYKERVIETDKLKLAQVYLNYETTGYIRVTVNDIYGQSEVNEFNGRVFGDVNNLVGFAPLIDGQYCFPVLQEAEKVTIEITSDSYLPLRIRDMEFSGQFTQRGKRI